MSVLNENQIQTLGHSPEEIQRLIQSHLELLRLSQALAKAAQMHRTAMNPQEVLDTGWQLDEALENLQVALDEG